MPRALVVRAPEFCRRREQLCAAGSPVEPNGALPTCTPAQPVGCRHPRISLIQPRWLVSLGTAGNLKSQMDVAER